MRWKHFLVYYQSQINSDRKPSRLIRAMSIKHAKTIFKKKGIKYRKNGTITILHPKILKVKPTEVMGVSFDTFETYKMWTINTNRYHKSMSNKTKG